MDLPKFRQRAMYPIYPGTIIQYKKSVESMSDATINFKQNGIANALVIISDTDYLVKRRKKSNFYVNSAYF